MTKRNPTEVDAYVGRRIRTSRMLIGMSQERLGELLGLTFQQVQKYEKGVNRVGAGRLFELAEIVGVPVSYFYKDIVTESSETTNERAKRGTDFLLTNEGVQLMEGFMSIKEPKVRRRILELIQALNDEESQPA